MQKPAIAFVAAALLLTVDINLASSQAEDWLFRCGEPRGYTVTFGDVQNLNGKSLQRRDDGPRWTEDGFSNIQPLVMYTQSSPKSLYLRWGGSRPNDLKDYLPEEEELLFDQIPIITHTIEVVYAAEIKDQSVWIYGFYPNLGFLTATRQSYRNLEPLIDEAVTSMFVAECERM